MSNIKDKREIKSKLEYKTIPFEIKESEESDTTFKIEGYAAGINNVDFGMDKIIPGAFKSTFDYINDGNKILLQWFHDMYEPLGLVTSAKEDENGLFISGEMPLDDTLVKGRVMPQIKIGSVASMSIGYIVIKESSKDGVRILEDVLVKEVSLVSRPMNDKANITGFKSLDVNILEELSERELEKQLIDGVKFSKQTAVKLVKLIKELSQRDAEEAKHRDDVMNDEDKKMLKNYTEKLTSIVNKLKE